MDMLSNAPSWQQQLRQMKADLEARHRAPPPRVPDPWEVKLAELTGEVHRDGNERLATFLAFEYLELHGGERRSGAARRLSRAMRQLGWEPARFQLSPGSYQRVRGFVRPASHERIERASREHEGGSVG
jgi:hypothetical protein